ncbi:MAG: flagellar protein FlaG [Lachnospiraceae bacterium]|nr:flagellar protein FlaG [Lachnospiraceae bacterium]
MDTKTVAVKKAEQKDNENSSDAYSYAEEQQQKSSAATEQIKKAVAKINKSINNSNEEAVFGIHEATNRVTIKIVDKESKKVIKELPPEKTLDMIAKVWEIAGIMVDEKR